MTDFKKAILNQREELEDKSMQEKMSKDERAYKVRLQKLRSNENSKMYLINKVEKAKEDHNRYKNIYV